MKISTTALWHNKKILAWLPKFGKTQSSVWVEWGAWLLEIVVRRRTQRAVDAATPPSAEPLSGSDIVPAVEPDTQPRH